jgi:2-haloacid dehalogenase
MIDWEGGIVSALTPLFPGESPERLLELHDRHETRIEAESAPPYREVLDQTAAAIAGELGVALPSSAEHALSDSLANWPAFPDVPAALAELRARGWKLGILSNVDTDLIAASLPKLGVPFDLVITRTDSGRYKPDFAHWRTFFERSGADPARYVHVAASLFHDIAPAAAQGHPSVWINRKAQTSDLPRNGELTTLTGLAATLEGIRPA